MLLIISARNYRYIMYLKKLRSTYLLSSIGFTLMFIGGIVINLLQLSQLNISEDIVTFNKVFSYIGSICVIVGVIIGLADSRFSDLKSAFGCLLAISVMKSVMMLCFEFGLFYYWGDSAFVRALILDFIWFAIYIVGGVGCLLLYRVSQPMIISVIGFGGIVIGSMLFAYIDYEILKVSNENMDIWLTLDGMESIGYVSQVFWLLGAIVVCVGWWVSFAAVGKESTPYAVSSVSSGQSRGTVPLANRQRSGARVTPAAYNPVAENGGYGGFSQNFDFGNQLAPQPQPASLSNDYKAKLKSATDSELMKILHDTTDKYSVEEQEDASMILFEKGSELLFGELRRYTPEQISEIANNPEEYFKGYVLAAKSLMKK